MSSLGTAPEVPIARGIRYERYRSGSVDRRAFEPASEIVKGGLRTLRRPPLHVSVTGLDGDYSGGVVVLDGEHRPFDAVLTDPGSRFGLDRCRRASPRCQPPFRFRCWSMSHRPVEVNGSPGALFLDGQQRLIGVMALVHRITDKLEKLIPETERVDIDHASHLMFRDNPDAFNAAVLGLLERYSS